MRKGKQVRPFPVPWPLDHGSWEKAHGKEEGITAGRGRRASAEIASARGRKYAGAKRRRATRGRGPTAKTECKIKREKSKRNASRTRPTCKLQWKRLAKAYDVWKQVLKNRRGLEKSAGHLTTRGPHCDLKSCLQKLLRTGHEMAGKHRRSASIRCCGEYLDKSEKPYIYGEKVEKSSKNEKI
jgi:hypothetical protein